MILPARSSIQGRVEAPKELCQPEGLDSSDSYTMFPASLKGLVTVDGKAQFVCASHFQYEHAMQVPGQNRTSTFRRSLIEIVLSNEVNKEYKRTIMATHNTPSNRMLK
jgi:hypothetical protein